MKILVPTDFSDNANNAFEFAQEIAMLNKGSITLLFAYYNIYDFAAQSSNIIVQMEQSAQKAMEKMERDPKLGVSVDHKIVHGPVASAITSTAYREDYDLIIMGTQGASGIRKTLVGSNTAHVIKDSLVPVLAVPFHSDYDNIREMVVTVKWDHSELNHFKKLVRLTKPWDWPIRTLHIKTSATNVSDKAMHTLEEFLEKKHLEISHTTVEAKSFLPGVDQYLKDADKCLLVMFTGKKTFFEYLLDHSDVEKMAYHTHVPLLVMK